MTDASTVTIELNCFDRDEIYLISHLLR